jgi:Fe-S cluster assembly iron-binding protein IscA
MSNGSRDSPSAMRCAPVAAAAVVGAILTQTPLAYQVEARPEAPAIVRESFEIKIFSLAHEGRRAYPGVKEEFPMIQLTGRAADGLKRILTAEGAPGDQSVKLVPDESGGVAMTFARPGKDDAVVGEGPRPLLIVDAVIAERLNGATLDLTADSRDRELRFVLRGSEPPAGG